MSYDFVQPKLIVKKIGVALETFWRSSNYMQKINCNNLRSWFTAKQDRVAGLTNLAIPFLGRVFHYLWAWNNISCLL